MKVFLVVSIVLLFAEAAASLWNIATGGDGSFTITTRAMNIAYCVAMAVWGVVVLVQNWSQL